MAAHDNDWVFVDINGNEVAADDPAVQTRYTRGEFKALDKEMVFGVQKDTARVSRKDDLPDAKSAHPADAAETEEGADASAEAAKMRHARK